jgi:hypothetical protein
MDENEQKQQLSLAYLHAVASTAGYACYVPSVDDDSVDRGLAARGRLQGILESPRIDVQLKSVVRTPLAEGEDAFSYRLKRKNYDDLRGVHMVPRLLVVLLLPQDPAEWVEQNHERMISRYAAYYLTLFGMPARENVRTVSVTIPRRNLFSVANLRRLMAEASRGKRKLT